MNKTQFVSDSVNHFKEGVNIGLIGCRTEREEMSNKYFEAKSYSCVLVDQPICGLPGL